jgi:hypothetical protein
MLSLVPQIDLETADDLLSIVSLTFGLPLHILKGMTLTIQAGVEVFNLHAEPNVLPVRLNVILLRLLHTGLLVCFLDESSLSLFHLECAVINLRPGAFSLSLL